MDRLKTKHFLYAFLMVLTFGTLGYRWIENWSWMDSFFMTVITVTTVGYREIGGDLGTWGKIFTTVLIFAGFGVAAFSLSHFTSMVLRGELNHSWERMRMNRKIKDLSDHYVLAGYGRTGEVIAKNLLAKKIPIVVIDSNAASSKIFEELGILYVMGDAADESVLMRAGLDRARGFIAVVSSDAVNAFAIMTARSINPRLNIIARALDEQSVRKLKIAGANRVIAPYVLGGVRIARSIFHPHAADFIDIIEDVEAESMEMADLPVYAGSSLDGARVGDPVLKSQNLMVVGVRKPDRTFVFQPPDDYQLALGDHLVVVGAAKNIEGLGI